MSLSKIPDEIRYLFISSANRNSGSNSKFTVYVPSNMLSNYDNKKKYLKVSMYDISLKYEWYNVQSINNSFSYYNGSTTTTITIPEGNYSVYELKDVLNSLLSTYVVTYKSTTNKYTFTSSNSTSSITPINSGSLFGIDNGTTKTGTFTSDLPVNMTLFNTLYLNTDLNTTNTNLDNLSGKTLEVSTVLDSIPIQVAPFDTIYYESENPSSFDVSVHNTQLTSITVFLSTNTGDLLDLKFPWSVTLQLKVFSE